MSVRFGYVCLTSKLNVYEENTAWQKRDAQQWCTFVESVVCRDKVIHLTNTVKSDTFSINGRHCGTRDYEDKQALAMIQ